MPEVPGGGAAPPGLVSGFLPGLPPFPVNKRIIYDKNTNTNERLQQEMQNKPSYVQFNMKAMNPHLESSFQLLLKEMNLFRSILKICCLGLLLQRLKPCLKLFPSYLSSVLLCCNFFLQTVNGGLQYSRLFAICLYDIPFPGSQ